MSYISQKTIKQLLEGLLEAMQGIKTLQTAKGIMADIRVTPVGGTVSSIGTVTTVSTVTNQSSIGGYFANQQVSAMQNLAAQSTINNIKITP